MPQRLDNQAKWTLPTQAELLSFALPDLTDTTPTSLLGSGIPLSNVSFVGHLAAARSFSAGANPRSLSEGIVLSMGSLASAAVRSNNVKNTNTDFGLPGDLSLETPIPGPQQTFDAARLSLPFLSLPQPRCGRVHPPPPPSPSRSTATWSARRSAPKACRPTGSKCS